MRRLHIQIDSDGRVTSSTPFDEYSTDDMLIVWVSDDFDTTNQSDYIYQDGELVYDGLYSEKLEKEALEKKLEKLKTSQIPFAISMYVQSNASNFTNDQAISMTMFFREYEVGVFYKKDDIIRYAESIYRIGQDHTSQEQWVPGETGTEALYSKIEITEEGYEVWQEWDGVSGSYANGQIVKDPNDEQLYKSLIDNNVWGPPSTQPTYWQLYVES